MQRLPRLVELVLAIALCALVAFWLTRVLRGEPIAAPPNVAPSTAGASNQRLDGVLASARLFGSRPPGALSDNVRALGVVADANGRGSVIVSVDGQSPKVYRVGDTLDGRLVAAIHPDRIELDSGGARQVFRLPPPQPTAAGMTVLGAAAPPQPAAPLPVVTGTFPQSRARGYVPPAYPEAGMPAAAAPPPGMAAPQELPPPPGAAPSNAR